MESDPQDLEKLLRKKKPNTSVFPTIDNIPNKKGYNFLLHPPMKDNTLVVLPENVNEAMESCFMKLITGGVMASVMGAAFGFVLGSFSQMTAPMTAVTIPVEGGPKPSVGSELKKSMRFTYLKGKSTARSMAVFGASYTALECVTERVLGAKSIWTNALAGCGAGLAFSARKGPMSACMSCIGFAAFGMVIDAFMF